MSSDDQCWHALHSLAACLEAAGDVVVRKTVMNRGGRREPAVRVLNPENAQSNVTVVCRPVSDKPGQVQFAWLQGLQGEAIPAGSLQEAAACVRAKLGLPPSLADRSEVKQVPKAQNPADAAGRHKASPEVTRVRVRLLADLAAALVDLERASRLVVDASGTATLMLQPVWGLPAVGVVVIQSGTGWAYLWGGSHRYPANDVDEVRAYLRRALFGVGVDLGDVELMACEAVTNAVRHTASGHPGGRVWVAVIVTDEAVRVEVTDEGGTSTEPHIPTSAVLSGRGLLIVHELADQWGWNRDGEGRVTVWFELARTAQN